MYSKVTKLLQKKKETITLLFKAVAEFFESQNN